ncbi:hypothetical protein [Paenibacillus nasutitermitis]|nr:hypothetical protein [Paenibacillus nasutitermitis]
MPNFLWMSSDPVIGILSDSVTLTLVIDTREGKIGEETTNSYKLVFTVKTENGSLKIIQGLRKKL